MRYESFMRIKIFTTGGTIDKIYFDAKSEFQVGEPQIAEVLTEANVTFAFEVESVLRKDSLDMTDADPQGNATSGVAIDKRKVTASTYEILVDGAKAESCIVTTPYENLHILPSSLDLAAAELEISDKKGRESILKNALLPIKQYYDYIIIDCPPSLGLITTNALTASDTFLVPIQCEYYALEGLTQLLHTINLVKSRLNPDLEMEGVVFTMYDARTNLSLQVVENVKDNLQERVYKTIIPRNVRLAEAPSHGLPINLYDARSTGAEAYHQLAEEVINRE